MSAPTHRLRLVLLVAVAAACASDDLSESTTAHEPAAVASPEALAEHAARQPGTLSAVGATVVDGWTGPGGSPFEVTLRTPDPAPTRARRFGTVTLETSLRSRAGNVGQYPCTSCHQGRTLVLRRDRIEDAHQEIRAEHPRRTGGTCGTCHAPENVELLALTAGDRVTLDHGYRLCAQCHFAQVDAWAAGAHGKRLDGWQGRRVVMACADCHDPHHPVLERRIPFRAPQIQRTRSDER